MPGLEQFGYLLPIAVATLCGGLLGAERELRGSEAGLRTNLLICVGSALIAMSGRLVIGGLALEDQGIALDPTRMASYVAAGIGFLGGGTIMRHGGRMHGLTSAATVWMTAAVGVCAGLELPVLALVATGFVLLVLRLLRPLRDRLSGPAQEHAFTVAVPDDELLRQRLHHLIGEYRARKEELAGDDGARWRISYCIKHREATEFLDRVGDLLGPIPDREAPGSAGQDQIGDQRPMVGGQPDQ